MVTRPNEGPRSDRKLWQAKDITDARMFAALAEVRGKHGVPTWSSLWDVQDVLSDIPPKVVLAKLRSMVKRKVLNGCCCGCRGDFELPEVTS